MIKAKKSQQCQDAADVSMFLFVHAHGLFVCLLFWCLSVCLACLPL